MATTLSILQQPTGLQSANNDSVFVVSSSAPFLGTGSNFLQYKVTADMYVGGQFQTTLKSYPDPNFGLFVFNTRNIVNNFVSYDFPNDSTASIFYSGSNSSANLQLKFGEEFFFTSSLSSSIFVQNFNLTSSNNINYLNGSLPFLEQVKTNLNNYVITNVTGSTAKFLTKATFDMPTYNNLNNYLYYFQSSSATTYLSITTYNSNNTNIGTYFIANSSPVTNGINIAATGFPQLSILVSGSGFSGTYAVAGGNPVMFNTNVTSYKAQIIGDNFIPYSEMKTFVITQDCNRFGAYAYSLMWLNELGGFDSFLFNRKNLTTQTKQTSEFKKVYGTLNSNGTYTINTWDRNKQTYYTSLQDSIELSTDFLTDQQVLYLKGLFSSPVVFAKDYNGNLFSCNVKNDNYPVNKSKVNTKVFSVNVTIEPSYNDFRQQL